MSETTDPLSVEDATKYLVDAAFHVTDPDSSDFGRMIVHSFAGGFGADRDLDGVLAEVEKAREIRWVDHLLGHDLAVVTDEGRMLCFDVKRPTGSQSGRSEK